MPTDLVPIIEKLSLKEGDIIVVRDPDVAKVLSSIKWPPSTPPCHIIVAEEGIQAISADALRSHLARIEEWDRQARVKS